MHPLVRYLVISCALVALAWSCFVFQVRGRTVVGHLRAYGDGQVDGVGDQLSRKWADWNRPLKRAITRPAKRRRIPKKVRKVAERRVARLREAARRARKPVVAPKKKVAKKKRSSKYATSVMALKPRRAKVDETPKTTIDERISKTEEKALDVILANRLEQLLPEDEEALDDLLDDRVGSLDDR